MGSECSRVLPSKTKGHLRTPQHTTLIDPATVQPSITITRPLPLFPLLTLTLRGMQSDQGGSPSSALHSAAIEAPHAISVIVKLSLTISVIRPFSPWSLPPYHCTPSPSLRWSSVVPPFPPEYNRTRLQQWHPYLFNNHLEMLGVSS